MASPQHLQLTSGAYKQIPARRPFDWDSKAGETEARFPRAAVCFRAESFGEADVRAE